MYFICAALFERVTLIAEAVVPANIRELRLVESLEEALEHVSLVYEWIVKKEPEYI